MNDNKKTKKQLIAEISHLRDRLEKIESILSPKETSDNKTSDLPFLKNTPVGLRSLEEQILFTRFSVEAAADEVFWMRDDSKIVYVNDSACKRLGYTREELVQMHVWDWDPLFPKERWEEFWEDMQQKKTRTFETRHWTKSGEIFPVEIVATVFEYSGEKYLFAFVRDITERKEKEAALQSEQKKYKTILQASEDGFWLADLQGRLLEVNDAYCRMSGYSKEELVDMSIPEIEGTMGPDEVASKIDEVLSKGYARFETKHLRKDGSLYEVDVSVQYLQTEDGGRLVNFIRDISPKILMEHSLREREVFLQSLLETIPDLIWLKDQDGTFLACNRMFERLLGDREENIIGKRDYDFLEKDRADYFREHDREAIAAGQPVSKEEWLTFAEDGRKALLETIKTPMFDHHRKLVGVLGIGRDITERKNMELEKAAIAAQLQQAQKMEAIGTLAGGIAHDFNNILSVIFGYAEMAREDRPGGEKYQQDLDQVLNAANRARELVAQILTFSRQARVKRVPIKIQPIIKEGLKMLRSSIPATISIMEDIEPKSGNILADPTQVHQILMNLCTNAYHSMENTGGALSVSLKTVCIGPENQEHLIQLRPGEYLMLAVADTGSGIHPDVIKKIFDPYFTTKESGKGTGMGLAIIHGIVTEYGGTITVESEPGKGACFHVYFPVIQKETLLKVTETEVVPKGSERVLFIDDEAILAQMGKAMLEGLGYQVTVKLSSLEALQTFQNTPHEFDIVITDQTMPDMTGADLARRMMQIRPDIPIILCTGFSHLIDEASAKAIGIKEFALKPLTKKGLGNLIRKALL